MLGHIEDKPRPFRPTNQGGGSKKGKKQINWPWLFKIVAEAVILREKGTEEAFRKNRTMLGSKLLAGSMNQLLPGWQKYRDQQFLEKYGELPDTDQVLLLRNRVYKALCYNGTSAGNYQEDIMTRANKSREHWSYYFGPQTEFAKLHDQVLRSKILVIKNWKRYL